jgi:hypothetical protein
MLKRGRQPQMGNIAHLTVDEAAAQLAIRTSSDRHADCYRRAPFSTHMPLVGELL